MCTKAELETWPVCVLFIFHTCQYQTPGCAELLQYNLCTCIFAQQVLLVPYCIQYAVPLSNVHAAAISLFAYHSSGLTSYWLIEWLCICSLLYPEQSCCLLILHLTLVAVIQSLLLSLQICVWHSNLKWYTFISRSCGRVSSLFGLTCSSLQLLNTLIRYFAIVV